MKETNIILDAFKELTMRDWFGIVSALFISTFIVVSVAILFG